MSKKKRFATLFTAAFVLLSGFTFPTQTKAAETDYTPSNAASSLVERESSATEVSEQKMLELETDSLHFLATANSKKSFYQEVQKSLLKHDTAFQVKYNGRYSDVADLDKLLSEITKIDNKKTSDDADYLCGSILYISTSANYTNSQAIFAFSVKYVETSNQLKKVNSKVKDSLKKLKISQYSDAGKVKVIHDYLVNLITYDETLVDHSSYGGLVDSKHTTVCQGYALLMYKMLTEAGVPCHYVAGTADGGPHAWNLVKLDGNWYALDATWDDPLGATPICTYDYFLVGSNTINKDHKMEANGFKVCSSNYNWQSNISKSSNKNDKKISTKQTSKDKEDAKLASQKAALASEMTSSLKKELNYTKASEYEKKIYDLYINIYVSIIKKLPKAPFQKLMKGDASVSNYYINETSKLVTNQILNPAISYIDTDEFLDDAIALMTNDFTQTELAIIAEMDQEDSNVIFEFYCYETLMNKLDELSEKYTSKSVKQIVNGCSQI